MNSHLANTYSNSNGVSPPFTFFFKCSCLHWQWFIHAIVTDWCFWFVVEVKVLKASQYTFFNEIIGSFHFL